MTVNPLPHLLVHGHLWPGRILPGVELLGGRVRLELDGRFDLFLVTPDRLPLGIDELDLSCEKADGLHPSNCFSA